MDYKEINKMIFEDRLQELLAAYQEVFDKIEYHASNMREGLLDTQDEVDKVMKELAGLYMSLTLVASITETAKEVKEVVQYNKLKMEKVGMGMKIVSSQLEKEANQDVIEIKKVKTVFQAYREMCNTAITVCQSSLKNIDKERKYN